MCACVRCLGRTLLQGLKLVLALQFAEIRGFTELKEATMQQMPLMDEVGASASLPCLGAAAASPQHHVRRGRRVQMWTPV